MKKRIDLRAQLLQAVAEKYPDRANNKRWAWSAWAKQICHVDEHVSNAFMLTGYFVPWGEAEVDIKPQLFLVKTTAGNRRSQARQYHTIVMMDADGNLTCIA